MTGTFDLKINDLGTPKLHKKHRIALEPSDGAFVRAKVTNQLVIDDLLMKKKIESHHHATAEYILNQAVKASMFTKTPRLDGVSSGRSGPKNNYTNGLLNLGWTFKKITRKFGSEAATLTYNVIVNNLSIKGKQVDIFKLILEHVDESNEERRQKKRNSSFST